MTVVSSNKFPVRVGVWIREPVLIRVLVRVRIRVQVRVRARVLVGAK